MAGKTRYVSLDLESSVFDQVFSVAPLVLVGTLEADGKPNLAPKHMATSLSWENHFGFVCTPKHATFQNLKRDGHFTVSYPNPNQVLLASLAAGGRCEDDRKPTMDHLPTVRARSFDGVLLRDAYLQLECDVVKIVDGFGENALIAGKIRHAVAAEGLVRQEKGDAWQQLTKHPILAYVHPGRFSRIDESYTFPTRHDTKR
jgi:flavin reductase (DIM6/NTAB) family NADH-FMN oxidoreductase RutF